MAYTLRNKCAKNLCKRTVLHQLIIKNVVTCFFGTQYTDLCQMNAYKTFLAYPSSSYGSCFWLVAMGNRGKIQLVKWLIWIQGILFPKKSVFDSSDSKMPTGV